MLYHMLFFFSPRLLRLLSGDVETWCVKNEYHQCLISLVGISDGQFFVVTHNVARSSPAATMAAWRHALALEKHHTAAPAAAADKRVAIVYSVNWRGIALYARHGGAVLIPA